MASMRGVSLTAEEVAGRFQGGEASVELKAGRWWMVARDGQHEGSLLDCRVGGQTYAKRAQRTSVICASIKLQGRLLDCGADKTMSMAERQL